MSMLSLQIVELINSVDVVVGRYHFEALAAREVTCRYPFQLKHASVWYVYAMAPATSN